MIDGSGTMVLDNAVIELHEGVVVYVPKGVKHKAVGKPTVLTVRTREGSCTAFTLSSDPVTQT